VAALLWDASFAFYGVKLSDLKESRSRVNCPSEYPRLLRLMSWAKNGGLVPKPADAVAALARIPNRMLLGLDGDPPASAPVLPTAELASSVATSSGASSASALPFAAASPTDGWSGGKNRASAVVGADSNAASTAASRGNSAAAAHALSVSQPLQQPKRVLPDLSSLPFPEGVQALRKAVGSSKALLQLDIKVRAISGGAGAASRGADPAVATAIEDLLASLGDDMAGRADVDIDALLECVSCLMDKASEWLRG
jgi:hypothetical protein